MIEMDKFESGLTEKEIQAIQGEVYCETCGHFACPVAEGDTSQEHKDLDEPCGDYGCCIN